MRAKQLLAGVATGFSATREGDLETTGQREDKAEALERDLLTGVN